MIRDQVDLYAYDERGADLPIEKFKDEPVPKFEHLQKEVISEPMPLSKTRMTRRTRGPVDAVDGEKKGWSCRRCGGRLE